MMLEESAAVPGGVWTMLGGTRLSLGSRFYFKNPEGHDSVGERPPCTQQDCSLTQAEPFLSCRRTYLQALVGCGPCWGGIRRSLGSRFNFNNPGGHGCRTLIVGAPLDTTGLFSNPGWTIPMMLEDSPADPGGVWTLLGVHAAESWQSILLQEPPGPTLWW